MHQRQLTFTVLSKQGAATQDPIATSPTSFIPSQRAKSPPQVTVNFPLRKWSIGMEMHASVGEVESKLVWCKGKGRNDKFSIFHHIHDSTPLELLAVTLSGTCFRVLKRSESKVHIISR